MNSIDGLWYRIPVYRYGRLEKWFCYVEGNIAHNKRSLWWRNIVNIGGGTNVAWDQLQSVFKRMGSGDNTMFWQDKWFGSSMLKDVFSGLFCLADIGLIHDGVGGCAGGVN